MLTLPASVLVFVTRGATNLRRSFDRLTAHVQDVLRQDPLSGHVFVFFNRQRNRVKMLVWERDGFWLLYKRLEAATFAVLDHDEITPVSGTCYRKKSRSYASADGTPNKPSV
jgi:transposase